MGQLGSMLSSIIDNSMCCIKLCLKGNLKTWIELCFIKDVFHELLILMILQFNEVSGTLWRSNSVYILFIHHT